MNAQLAPATEKKSLILTFAERYGIDATRVLDVLKATAFKQKSGEVTNEQMMALLIVANEYKLNPFTREIFAFPDKQNGIVPVVGVDGWSRILNSHPQLDGIEFEVSETMVRPDGALSDCPQWMECRIYRKDRSRPVVVREYLDEVYRAPFKSRDGYNVSGPWQTHPKRFLRHKSMIQCGRLAFGFGGIYDQDEAERINEVQTIHQAAPVVDLMPKAKPEARLAPEEIIEDAEVHEAEVQTEEEVAEFSKAIDLSPSALKTLETKVRQAGRTMDDIIEEFAPITKDNITDVLKSLQ